MPSVEFKNVFRYAALPEIMPRVRTLMFGGLGYIPFFIAIVYQMVGLLPKDHPYIMQKNIGRFGVHHVLAEAANNLTFSLKNIDQIILYIAVLAGIVIFMIQIFALFSLVALQPAMAAFPVSWKGFFTVPSTHRPHDIAYMMLDMVFGVPYPSSSDTGFFESCVSTSVSCIDSSGSAIGGLTVSGMSIVSPLSTDGYKNFPFPFHVGLHKIFGIYNSGLMIIAIIMIVYFVITVVGETAQTGTPFGKRFNKTWVPLRIVIAIGLLMPLSIGLNSAQYIVLYAAKYGSAFATNGWRYFNDTLKEGYTSSGQRLVSMPNVPDMNELTEFMFVARTCQYIANYYLLMDANKKAEASGDTILFSLPSDKRVRPYVLLSSNNSLTSTLIDSNTTYDAIVGATAGAVNIAIRFGVKDEEKNKNNHSGVKPVCGDIVLPWIDNRDISDQTDYVKEMQKAYYELVRDLWYGDVQNGISGGEKLAYSATQYHRYRYYAERYVAGLPDIPDTGKDPQSGVDSNHNVPLDAEYVQNINDKVSDRIQTAIQTAVNNAENSDLWETPNSNSNTGSSLYALYTSGWAAAGIWYNRIAQVNGQLTAAVFGVPKVMAYPDIMEAVSDNKAKSSNLMTLKERFNPESPAGVVLDKASGLEFAKALYYAKNSWDKAANMHSRRPRGNPVLGVISYILGLDGLYNMQNNSANSTHPLAQLSGVGRSLVESSIRSLGYAAGASLLGGILGPVPKQLMYVISSFFITTAMLGLTVGFVLFYVLPFLPFIYFFFAVGGWIKGMFEAMVGAPLWALAHIRIDGDGMPGNAAMNGYFLIFEVFLRPILIVFGMLASISIFSALVNVLNSIFPLVAQNAAGYDMESQIADGGFSGQYVRSLIDQFFFTVIYTIICYMIGMSAFKLIDLIPNNILRWMGQTVATFGDTREDPAQGLSSRASIGSQQVLGKLGGGLDGIAKAVSGA